MEPYGQGCAALGLGFGSGEICACGAGSWDDFAARLCLFARADPRCAGVFSGTVCRACLMSNVTGPNVTPQTHRRGAASPAAVGPCSEETQLFRDILQLQILGTWPLAPGNKVLGDRVLRHSSLSLRTVACLMRMPEADIQAAIKTDEFFAG